tara:strand:- start:61 stop:474 length:414 start_codon:yes stop_codon:yes gene_type:complete
MEKHFKLTDSDFEKKIISCEFNPSDFTHEAHLRLAWINIKKYGINQAEINIQSELRNFVEFVGDKDKYNMTLTMAAIRAVYHFMLKSKADNFKGFIMEFPRLKNNFRDLMSYHYGFDIYNSERAKVEFLQPDLIPFD